MLTFFVAADLEVKFTIFWGPAILIGIGVLRQFSTIGKCPFFLYLKKSLPPFVHIIVLTIYVTN